MTVVPSPSSLDSRGPLWLCRARKDLVAHRVAVANQLRAHLTTTLPAAVGLFAEIDSAISLQFLARFTTQDALDWLSPKRLAAWLKSVGYCGRQLPPISDRRAGAGAFGVSAGTVPVRVGDGTGHPAGVGQSAERAGRVSEGPREQPLGTGRQAICRDLRTGRQ